MTNICKEKKNIGCERQRTVSHPDGAGAGQLMSDRPPLGSEVTGRQVDQVIQEQLDLDGRRNESNQEKQEKLKKMSQK